MFMIAQNYLFSAQKDCNRQSLCSFKILQGPLEIFTDKFISTSILIKSSIQNLVKKLHTTGSV